MDNQINAHTGLDFRTDGKEHEPPLKEDDQMEEEQDQFKLAQFRE